MKGKGVWGFVFLVVLVAWGNGQQIVPVAVSPGSESGVAVVAVRCPTFSWSSIQWAVGYRVAVFEATTAEVAGYEAMAAVATPVLSKEIQGQALSWTPSARERLRNGGLYVWYVQATDASGRGIWSAGKVFEVEMELSIGQKKEGGAKIEDRLSRRLKEKGVSDGVIADVAKEVKSELGGGEIARDFSLGGSDQSSGKIGTQAYEGPTNTFYGHDAGAKTTGTDNSFFGSAAGYFNLTGAYNSFFGFNAGYSNTGGNSNTFVGRNAGYSNLTGNENTFIGLGAGYSNATTTDNTFVGFRAGFSNTGWSNTFIGHQAGYSNAGRDNTFIGHWAGYSNLTGYSNSFIGGSAGYYNTKGYSNTFIGHIAGNYNTEGNYNTFIGESAGLNNTTGQSNTFCGDSAGGSNTEGYDNTFIGMYAGFANKTGRYNTSLGYDAGRYNTTGVGNVFLGYEAGYPETGSYKLYISNSTSSFPLIYGDFSTSIVGINGRLGVGTKAPAYALHILQTGANASMFLERTDGAKTYVSATTLGGYFGTQNNFPLKLMVNGALRMQLSSDNSLAMSNGASCTTGGVWKDASSRQLKENIEGLTAEEAKDVLDGLNPVKYNYKVDKEDRHVGFIAEDVPELVAMKDRKGLSPMDVVAVLTKVVQEQQQLVKDQQNTIKELQKRVTKLEKKAKSER